MTKWIVSTPLKGTDLMKNFVCFGEAELRKLLEQYPDASVEMKDSHLEDYPEMKDYSLISTAQTENYIQVNDKRYTLDEFNRVGDYLLGRGLTDDQQEVLEWLQIYADKDSGDKPFQTIFFLWDCIKSNNLGNDELSALRKLTRAEQFQVLAAFASYGLEGNQ